MRSLVALTLACALAATFTGLVAEVFAFRSAYAGTGREELFLLMRLVVLLALVVLLVVRGGRAGIAAAVAMVFGVTFLEWLLMPLAHFWASISEPAVQGEFQRPGYWRWATFDIIGLTVAAVFAHGLRLIATANPDKEP